VDEKLGRSQTLLSINNTIPRNLFSFINKYISYERYSSLTFFFSVIYLFREQFFFLDLINNESFSLFFCAPLTTSRSKINSSCHVLRIVHERGTTKTLFHIKLKTFGCVERHQKALREIKVRMRQLSTNSKTLEGIW
jgi:hypothetical protein